MNFSRLSRFALAAALAILATIAASMFFSTWGSIEQTKLEPNQITQSQGTPQCSGSKGTPQCSSLCQPIGCSLNSICTLPDEAPFPCVRVGDSCDVCPCIVRRPNKKVDIIKTISMNFNGWKGHHLALNLTR